MSISSELSSNFTGVLHSELRPLRDFVGLEVALDRFSPSASFSFSEASDPDSVSSSVSHALGSYKKISNG